MMRILDSRYSRPSAAVNRWNSSHFRFREIAGAISGRMVLTDDKDARRCYNLCGLQSDHVCN